MWSPIGLKNLWKFLPFGSGFDSIPSLKMGPGALCSFFTFTAVICNLFIEWDSRRKLMAIYQFIKNPTEFYYITQNLDERLGQKEVVIKRSGSSFTIVRDPEGWFILKLLLKCAQVRWRTLKWLRRQWTFDQGGKNKQLRNPEWMA